MKFLRTAFLVLIPAVLLVGLFLWLDPFGRTSDALDHAFGAPPKWTQVENVYQNPQTQELSHGEQSRQSLQILSDFWKSKPGVARICFIGNSQMHTISLAPGEQPVSEPEKTYVDLTAEEYAARTQHPVLTYRLSAPGMSYTEALWYVDYLSGNPDLKPDVLVLQVNYQAFWRDGIRDGMLDMLEDAAFHDRIEAEARAGSAYAGELAQALNRYQELRKAAIAAAPESKQKESTAQKLETGTRALLDHMPQFQRRDALRASFFEMLYRSRLYFLRMKPSDARSISGVRLTRSQAALERIAALCKQNGIRLVLFEAPLNPRVTLYKTDADRQAYAGFLRRITEEDHVPVYDLERSVPAEDWGRLLNGPDPLHLGRQGHRIVAGKITELLMKQEGAQ